MVAWQCRRWLLVLSWWRWSAPPQLRPVSASLARLHVLLRRMRVRRTVWVAWRRMQEPLGAQAAASVLFRRLHGQLTAAVSDGHTGLTPRLAGTTLHGHRAAAGTSQAP